MRSAVRSAVVAVCWLAVSTAHAVGACGDGLPTSTVASPAARDRAWQTDSVSYLGETHNALVYLPEGYPARSPYPVVYLLHGWAMGPDMWMRSDLQAEADRRGYVLVAPEGEAPGLTPSWYSCQARLPYPGGTDWQVSFCEWFFDGVLPHVEATYAVRRDAGGRALAGYSMGGKGALSLAAHRPDLFAATAAYGPIVDLRDYSGLYDIPAVYGPRDENALPYAADSPIELAANMQGLSIALFHGAEDTEWAHYSQSRRMHEALDALGYRHVWEELPDVEHDVTTHMIAATCEMLDAAFSASPVQRTSWRFRFAGRRSWQVYDALLVKTDPLAWTEVLKVTTDGFRAVSGDAFRYVSAPEYEPLAGYSIAITDVSGERAMTQTAVADARGRLTVVLGAGEYDVSIALTSPTPTLEGGSTAEPTDVAPPPTVPTSRQPPGVRWLPLLLRG